MSSEIAISPILAQNDLAQEGQNRDVSEVDEALATLALHPGCATLVSIEPPDSTSLFSSLVLFFKLNMAKLVSSWCSMVK